MKTAGSNSNQRFAKPKILSVLSLIVLWPAASWAELFPPNKAGVAMGQLYYRVRDVEANRKFWIALGAAPVLGSAPEKTGAEAVLRFPDVMIVLTRGASSGGSDGSVVNHVGFRVPNVAQVTTRMMAAGFKAQGTGRVGNVFSPEGERIELLEDLTENTAIIPDKRPDGPEVKPQKMTVPITLHHIHFFVPDGAVPEIKAWYVKMFGGIPGRRFHYEAADFPGVNLNFSDLTTQVPPSPPGAKLVPTKGRMLDHIGFEVNHLEAFCKKLEANSVKLDVPYKKRSSGFANAYLTDPWGTYIELTEGLNRL